jgi:hypothetical protein
MCIQNRLQAKLERNVGLYSLGPSLSPGSEAAYHSFTQHL